MGIKISNLPNNALPYTGSEKIPLVQDGQTRGGTLSSFVNYLSGALLSDSELRALSGNWQNTYTTFSSNSANYAVKNANNNFTAGQTITGSITAATFVLSGGTSPLAYSMKRFNGTGSFGITNTLPSNTTGNYIIAFGQESAIYAGIGGTATDIVAFGQDAGGNAGYSGVATDIVAIGKNAGNAAGITGTATDIVAIGQGAGEQVGNAGGDAINIVAIGNNACGGAGGIAGTADYIVAVGYGAATTVGSSGIANHIVAIGTAAAGGAAAGGGIANDIIAIGRNAGAEAGYFEYNTVTDIIAIGRDAGRYTGVYELSGTVSENNVFIGLSSGYTKQGSRNTFVGDLTNTSPTSATSLSGCIAIGYGATPTARNTMAIGSASTPLSVVPGGTIGSSLSGLKIMINGKYFTIPLLA